MLRNLFFKSNNSNKDYRRYRWFVTSEGNVVVGGKNEDQNELVIKNFLKPNYRVVHTTSPGSGFMIIQSENPSEQEVEEMAIYCACFSKKWKTLKSASEKIKVDVFNGNQIYKMKTMDTGTFGVNGEKKTVSVKSELAIIFQNGRLRAIPKIKNKKKKGIEILVEIKPGKLNKEKAVKKIFKKIRDVYNFPISKEEIISVIPSDKMSVK